MLIKYNSKIIEVRNEDDVKNLKKGKLMKHVKIVAVQSMNEWLVVSKESDYKLEKATKEQNEQFNKMSSEMNVFLSAETNNESTLMKLSDDDFYEHLNTKDDFGNLRLTSVVINMYNEDKINPLLNRATSLGIDINTQNIKGHTLYSIACRRGNFAIAIGAYNHGADPLLKTKEGKYAHEYYTRGDEKNKEVLGNIFKSANALTHIKSESRNKNRVNI